MTKSKQGQIVWHDLFTKDLDIAKSFYADIAGWRYVTEHAQDFSWGGGEKDFVLALSDGEAGAGFIDLVKDRPGDWIPYVEVADVDRAADLAANLGGDVARPPFEVPGVGRNCLLHDPLGAPVGISLSRHDFPAPTRQFGPEYYLMGSGDFPARFYRQLFGWEVASHHRPPTRARSVKLADTQIAAIAPYTDNAGSSAQWIPSVRVGVLSDALAPIRALKGKILATRFEDALSVNCALVQDPNGATSLLIDAQA